MSKFDDTDAAWEEYLKMYRSGDVTYPVPPYAEQTGPAPGTVLWFSTEPGPTAQGTAGNTQAERDALPLWDYMFGYFPDAFLEEVAVAVSGNRQHNPGDTGIRWARGKSMDHKNKFFRHVWDHSRGIKKDTDGTWHLAKAIWRLKAWLQEEIEKERREEVKEYVD